MSGNNSQLPRASQVPLLDSDRGEHMTQFPAGSERGAGYRTASRGGNFSEDTQSKRFFNSIVTQIRMIKRAIHNVRRSPITRDDDIHSKVQSLQSRAPSLDRATSEGVPPHGYTEMVEVGM